MPEHDARPRAVYDYADDEPRPTGRRRRQVADWGVGEELFDGMPGRRFERRGADHGIPRSGADEHVTGGDADDRGTRSGADEDTRRTRARDDVPRAGVARTRARDDIPRGGVADGRRTIVIADQDVPHEPEPRSEEFASREDALEARRRHDAVWAGDEPFAAPAPPPTAARPDEIARGGVDGRRTVKIGGRPAEFYSPPGRRRRAPTIQERLGPRPDRIAAWACALGLLLILIAIATANV